MDAPTLEKKTRGRPPKNQEGGVEAQELLAPLQIEDIHHVMRAIALPGRDADQDGSHYVGVVEDYLRQAYFSQGYTLYSIEHLRTEKSEGVPIAEQMMYVLVKYAQ